MVVFAVLGILGAGAVIIILALFAAGVIGGSAFMISTIVSGSRQMTGDASPATDPPPFGW